MYACVYVASGKNNFNGTFYKDLTQNMLYCMMTSSILFQVKEVAPRTGTAVTRTFWKKDLKTTREYLKGHIMAFNSTLTDTVISELGVCNRNIC